MENCNCFFFFFSSRRRHTRCYRDWSSDVCSSDLEELIENIDIGGPAMVRSAAKNFQSVGVVTDPGDYPAIAAELRERGELSVATRLNLARKAYARTARYDGEIATELERLSVSDAAAGGNGIVIGAL